MIVYQRLEVRPLIEQNRDLGVVGALGGTVVDHDGAHAQGCELEGTDVGRAGDRPANAALIGGEARNRGPGVDCAAARQEGHGHGRTAVVLQWSKQGIDRHVVRADDIAIHAIDESA